MDCGRTLRSSNRVQVGVSKLTSRKKEFIQNRERAFLHAVNKA